MRMEQVLIKLATALLFSSFVSSSYAVAAACCGGGFALPSIITNDDNMQISTSFAESKVDTDVFSNGNWQKRTNNDVTQSFKIDAAHLISDRWQVGLSTNIIKRSRDGSMGGSEQTLGDSTVSIGYEALPDWDYNPYRPHIVTFTSLNIPTGKSIYESDTGIGSSGRGFWALTIGSVLNKSWGNWDTNATIEIHKGITKSIRTADFDGQAQPGFGHSYSFGGGYSLRNLRFGTSIAWNYEDPIKLISSSNTNTANIPAAEQRFATGSAIISYMPSNDLSLALSYSDQTIFGDPTNTTLSKTVSFLLQKKWAR